MNYQKRPVGIEGWEMYQVDTLGNVYAKNGKILKWSHNHSGYRMVNFYHNHNRKGFAIHTLVAKTFLPIHDEEHNQVNHIDGDKDNNCIENLEWVTPTENVRHSVEILGNNIGSNNPNSKHIYGYDKRTNELIYDFPSLIDAGHYFAPEDVNKARHIQKMISRVNTGWGGKKSYRGCIWTTEYII